MSSLLKDSGLTLEDLKLAAEARGIRNYESMSEAELLSVINPSKKAKKGKKPKTSFSKSKIKKIRKEFNESRSEFSKLKIKHIRENLYKIEKKKNLFESKIKEIETYLTELEENLSKTKEYYDYDDSEYRGIRNVRDLFDLSIDEDYYEPIIVKNKLDYYRGKNCMKNFCLDLREHATKIIDYEKKEMIPLTKKIREKHNKQEVCHICKKGFSADDSNKNIIRLEIIVTILENIEVLLMISAS